MSAFDFAREWEINELLSLGGAVAVYAATHRRGRRGALKIELGRKRWSDDRFCREVALADAASSVGAPALLGYGAMADARYVIFELVEGHTLEAHSTARGGRFDLATALFVTERLAGAVERLHAIGIVHRRLEPSNVLITEYGEIRVIDFGNAARRDAPVDEGACFAPGFAPAEQVEGTADPFDARGDVFALGAILYWMLTGTSEPVHRLSKGFEVAVSIDELAHLPMDVVDFVDHALAREPHRRTRDARTFRRGVQTLHRQSGGLTTLEETVGAC